MPQKFTIPILISTDEFPCNCLNTYINLDKNFLNKKSIEQLIDKHLKVIENHQENYEKELIFIGKSYFDLEPDFMITINEIVAKYLDNKQINYATIELMPHDINFKNLMYLKKRRITNIELQAYSANNDVLKIFEFRYNDIKKAIRILKLLNINFGIHQLIGLPNSKDLDLIETAKKFKSLKPKFIRLNNLYITHNSYMEELYNQKKYDPYSIEQLTDILNCIAQIYNFHNNDFQIKFGYYEFYGEEVFYEQNYNEVVDIGIRNEALYKVKNKKVVQVGKLNKLTKNSAKLDFKSKIVARPYEENLKQIVEQNMWYDALAGRIKKLNQKVKKIEVSVNPYEYDVVIGKKYSNYNKLKQVYDLEINFKMDQELDYGKINIDVVE